MIKIFEIIIFYYDLIDLIKLYISILITLGENINLQQTIQLYILIINF